MKSLVILAVALAASVSARAQLSDDDKKVLTAQEQACYADLQACYPKKKLTAADTPARYVYTRKYLHSALDVDGGTTDAALLPVRTKAYDAVFLTGDETTQVANALDKSIAALLNVINS